MRTFRGPWPPDTKPEKGLPVKSLNERLINGENLFDKATIDLVAVSPLWHSPNRSNRTEQGSFNAEHNPPTVVCPLAAERCYMEADVGRPRSVLEAEFPQFDYSALPKDDSAWWYEGSTNEPEWRPPGQYKCGGEPKDAFGNRMIALKKWLAGREESNILLVAHWGTINSLTGVQFSNCEIRPFKFSQLLSDEEILRANV